MIWRTHLAFGTLIGILLLPIIKPNNVYLYFWVVLFASLLPDIDHNKSKFGRKVKIISFLSKHRGILHSVFAILFFISPFYYLRYYEVALAIIIGYGSHLIGDMITRQGVAPFYPLPLTIKGFMRTNSLTEYAIFFACILVVVWKVYSLWI